MTRPPRHDDETDGAPPSAVTDTGAYAGHPTEEDLTLQDAGLLSPSRAQKIEAHLSACDQCREIVKEAARGLAMLANASDPPADMLQHARARRWATKRDAPPVGLPFEEAEDVAEVSGRGREADEADNNESADSSETDCEPEQ